jgi:hypothetical protein
MPALLVTKFIPDSDRYVSAVLPTSTINDRGIDRPQAEFVKRSQAFTGFLGTPSINATGFPTVTGNGIDCLINGKRITGDCTWNCVGIEGEFYLLVNDIGDNWAAPTRDAGSAVVARGKVTGGILMDLTLALQWNTRSLEQSVGDITSYGDAILWLENSDALTANGGGIGVAGNRAGIKRDNGDGNLYYTINGGIEWIKLVAVPLANYAGTRRPLVTDDINAGYSLGSQWIVANATPRELWFMINSAAGAAVWVRLDNVIPGGFTSIGDGLEVSVNVLKAKGANSITILTAGISLVNDEATPGADKIYGTDDQGVKGWINKPTGGAGTVVGAVFGSDAILVSDDTPDVDEITISVILDTASGLVISATGMKADIDGTSIGIVPAGNALEVVGASLATASTYFGKDAGGNLGFHALPDGGIEYTAGTGITIDLLNEIAVDTDVIATQQFVSDAIDDIVMPDPYTAGTGITIVTNEIAVDTSVIATQTFVTDLIGAINDAIDLINGDVI